MYPFWPPLSMEMSLRGWETCSLMPTLIMLREMFPLRFPLLVPLTSPYLLQVCLVNVPSFLKTHFFHWFNWFFLFSSFDRDFWRFRSFGNFIEWRVFLSFTFIFLYSHSFFDIGSILASLRVILTPISNFTGEIEQSLAFFQESDESCSFFPVFVFDLFCFFFKRWRKFEYLGLEIQLIFWEKITPLFGSQASKKILGWSKVRKEDSTCPHLLNFISWFNKISRYCWFLIPSLPKIKQNIQCQIIQTKTKQSWVATEVCMAGNMRTRVAVIKYFVTVARYCASWNNYNTVFEIVSGLNLPSVYRLKKSWEALPSKYRKCISLYILSLSLSSLPNFFMFCLR